MTVRKTATKAAGGRPPAAERPLTDQQQAAMRTGVSIGLSAGAGCGKTSVLTRRFLSHLSPGTEAFELSQLVAITFTERAAREMRNRIRKECRSRLQNCPDDEVDHWLGLTRQLDTARVSTIHSFCASLLRANAVEAGLDPKFALFDEVAGSAFLRARIDEALQQRLAARDADAGTLVYEYDLNGTREILERLIAERYRLDFDHWRGQTAERLVQHWQKHWEQTAIPELMNDLQKSATAVSVIKLLQEHVPSHPVMQERRRILLDVLPRLAESNDPRASLELLRENALVQGGGAASAWPDPAAYNAVKDGLTELRNAIRKLLDNWDWNPVHARTAAEVGLAALRLVESIGTDYDRHKRAQAALDFDDLLLGARDLLRNHPAVRRRAAAGIGLLMVDEFQDTDPIQAEIVELLCGDDLLHGKLFLVGDVKQSIYRFRRADPAVFRRLRERLPEAGRLPLTTNFRSQPAILNFVNALFDGELGNDYEPLKAPAEPEKLTPKGPPIEFLFSSPDQNAGANEGESENADAAPAAKVKETVVDRRRREAEWIARRLKTILTDGVPRISEADAATDKPVLRTARCRDVVILFRAMTAVREYEEALRRHGLKYYVVGGQAFYAQQEVFDLVNLCRCLDDPDDEVALVGVLRSPFFSLSDDAVFALAEHVDLPNFAAPVRISLFARLRQPPPTWLSDEQRERVAFAGQVLSELRSQKDRLPLARLLTLAVDRTGYDAALLTEFLGERKLANLRKLIDLARQFDQSGLFTLADFVDQLQDAVGEETKESLAALHPESSDVIRLMSIHQSKGLEFPIVVIADMDRRSIDRAPSARFDLELGPLVGLRDKFDEPRDNLGMRLYQLRERAESLAETQRLLYVATTRAADWLILSANLTQAGKVSHPWLKLLSQRFDLQTGQPRTAPTHEGLSVLVKYADCLPKIAVHHSIPDLPHEKSPHAPRRVPLGKLREAVLAAEPAPPPAMLAEIPVDRMARVRFSVSDLEQADAALRGTESAPAEAAAGELDDVPRPSAMDSSDSILLGTLVHTVLEHAEYGATADIRQSQLDRASVAAGLEPGGRIHALAADCLAAFFASPACRELGMAAQVHREIEFLLAWPLVFATPASVATGAFLPAGSGESGGRHAAAPRLISGTLDCLAQTAEGAWVVIDYKTSRVSSDKADADFLAEYDMQLAIYALAVRAWLGQWPDRVELALLRDAARRVPFDAAAADWTSILSRIDAAMTSIIA